MKRGLIILGGVILITSVLLLGLGACLAPQRAPVTSPPTAPAPPRFYPDIESMGVRVLIDDGQLTDTVLTSIGATGVDPSARWSGEAVFYLDVAPPTDPDASAFTAEGTYQRTLQTSVTWEDVAPGEHTFSVQLLDIDETPLDPPVMESISFTVPHPELKTRPW